MGSQVLLSTSYLCMLGVRKLSPCWINPFHVAARAGVVVYHLELPSQYKLHNMFHVSLLKGYNNSGVDKAELNSATIVFELGSNREFEVEHILEHQHVGCNRAL